MNLSIETSIECESWRLIAGLDGLIRDCLQASIQESGDTLGDGAEVSLLLCDDERIRSLNSRFRGFDKPTNVLSFPSPEPLEVAHALGDIAIAYETVAREADEEHKTFSHHFCHMIVHGFLHLLGYDHKENEEAEMMEATEARVLHRLGIADPYRDHVNSEGQS